METREHTHRTLSRFLGRTINFSIQNRTVERGLALIVDYLCKTFNVATDEVALLVLDRQGKSLQFIAPDYLARLSALIPFEPTRSVAARCLWDRKARIENRLPVVNHLAYFEKTKHGNPRPHRIEKLLSFPVTLGVIPLGVVQISRKRSDHQAVIPDFRQQDIAYLDAIREPLQTLLQSVRSAMKTEESHPLPASPARKAG